MQELKNENNIVETLRLKIEESDIKEYLKSNFGGYTKNSVMDYLNILRKQQQAMADTFSHNQQSLFEEKENLKKENEALKMQITRIESEYEDLSQSFRINGLEGEEISAPDITGLKNNISALEEKLNRADNEKKRLEKQIEQQKSLTDDFSQKLEQSRQELSSAQELLKTELLKVKDQSALVSKLSNTIEERDEELAFLNSLVSKGQLADLTAKVNDLTEQLASQTEVLKNCNSENSSKSKMIEMLNQENDSIKQRISDLSKILDESNSQNEKISAENKVLNEQLENEYKKCVTLIREKSGVTIDKLSVSRKLDEANSKVMLLELQLKKQTNAEEKDAVQENETIEE